MKTFNKYLGPIVILLIVVGAAIYGFSQFNKSSSEQMPAGGRQAVFLTNGQVYFGKITKETGRALTLENVYYLQVQEPIQPAKEGQAEQPQISLVKLGNELHGPKDRMVINREHILFVEDMKDDSKVNEAIAEYIKTGGQPQQPAGQTTTPSTTNTKQ